MTGKMNEFDKEFGDAVAQAVTKAAIKDGVAKVVTK